jgi:hypothetical protein
MKRQISIIGLAVLFAASVMFVSCEKEDQVKKIDVSAALTVAEDDASSDNLYDDVYSEMDENVTDLEANSYVATDLKSAYAEGTKTITVSKPDTLNFPKTIIIEYENWTDKAGRIKNGKIVIVITGPYRKIGSEKTITLENFTIDSIAIEGTHTIKNLGRNGDGYLQYEAKLTGGKVTFPDGKVVTREFERTRTWIAGEITPRFIWDDAYLIEGSAWGINRNGVSYTRTITVPLYIAAACPWIAKGTVTVVAGDKTMTINYGGEDALCDNKAIVTINGETKEITLHRGYKRN